MIFDLTYIDSYETFRYKPRNKASCRGVLLYSGDEIASLESLSVAHSTEQAIVSGKFNLEWHRMEKESPFTEGTLDLIVEYKYKQELEYTWKFYDIQILFEGAPMAIRSLSEVMGTNIIFFSKNMEFRDEH